MSEDIYDGVVLGTGHNSLILQAYLCRSGLRVLSLDRSQEAGGGLATVENPRLPGFWHNTHAFFHRAANSLPWYEDLELSRHGAVYLEPELNVAMILRDGRCLQWWTDLQSTVDSFAQFSRKDAVTVSRLVEEFRPIVEKIVLPEAQSPPLPSEERRERLLRTPMGRRLLEVAELSPLEFVEKEFESEVIKAGLLFFNGLREVDLRLKGFGHSIPALLASSNMAQMCVGGSAQLARSIIEDIKEHGGEVRTGTELQSILVNKARVAGIELTNGERIYVKGFVASGLNPQQTFLRLVPADILSRDLRRKVEEFQYNLLAPLFSLNLALSEPPRYKAESNYPELRRAFMVILGLETYDQFSEIVRAHEEGQIPETVMWGACPTLFDPGQAPPGQHTAFMWEKLPYCLEGDPSNWDRVRENHGNKMLRLWSTFASNLTEDVVLDSFSRSPLDVERTLPNMKYGDLLVGSFANGQIGYNRPFAGAGAYRTPIRGLYLCGGSCHPGGNITGLCGYNAASIVAADLQINRWWRRRHSGSIFEN